MTNYSKVEFYQEDVPYGKDFRRLPDGKTRHLYVVHTIGSKKHNHNYTRSDSKNEAEKIYNKKMKQLIK